MEYNVVMTWDILWKRPKNIKVHIDIEATQYYYIVVLSNTEYKCYLVLK